MLWQNTITFHWLAYTWKVKKKKKKTKKQKQDNCLTEGKLNNPVFGIKSDTNLEKFLTFRTKGCLKYFIYTHTLTHTHKHRFDKNVYFLL